jgi:hypothetical protein
MEVSRIREKAYWVSLKELAKQAGLSIGDI